MDACAPFQPPAQVLPCDKNDLPTRCVQPVESFPVRSDLQWRAVPHAVVLDGEPVTREREIDGRHPSPPSGRHGAPGTALREAARQVPGVPEIRAAIAPSDQRARVRAALARCYGRAYPPSKTPSLFARRAPPSARRPDQPPCPGACDRAASRRRCGSVSRGESATGAALRRRGPRNAAGPRQSGGTTELPGQRPPRPDHWAARAGRHAASPPTDQ